MTTVMAFGTFDGVHPGHLHFLKEAKKLGDFLMVVIARDANVIQCKKHAARADEKERQRGVRETGIADEVILGDLNDLHQPIRNLKPDVIALGYDQSADLKKLEQEFPSITLVRLKAFKPNQYKSSLVWKKKP